MNITFFQRKPYEFHFSIEKLFDAIRSNFSNGISYNIYTLPYYSKGFWLRIKSGLAAKRNQGDINHITGDIHFITPFLDKNKTINTYHDFTFLKITKGIKRSVLWFCWVYLPVRYSKYVTVISEATKQELISICKVSEKKIIVIPNIISNDFRFHKKNFNKEKPAILHIGTTPNKNLNRLIEAVSKINCKLIIIGQLTEEHKVLLKKYSIDHENFFQISDEELREKYIKCDIVSFCSLNEGFGLPILEAQATGRAVVTSNISSMPEVAGDAASYVDPYDINSIREGIKMVIDDDIYRANLIKEGLKNINRFKSSTVAGMYEALYKKIFQELT